MLTLPGLIDPHVHLRDPGQTEKEDFYTGTSAALAGGFTTILDMPNNKTPITTLERLEEKILIAKEKIVCDVGFYFGSQGNNLEEFEKVKDKALGLKLYLNQTTGNFLIDKQKLEKIFIAWQNSNNPSYSSSERSESRSNNETMKQFNNQTITKPILVHVEGETIEDVINVVRKIKVPTHFCHISKADELKMIFNAKEQGIPITCGVTPHHLFLTENDAKILGPFGQMKPPLSTKKDQDFLWKNLSYIDIIESDHAPHTKQEKLTNKKAKAGDASGGADEGARLLDRRGFQRTASSFAVPLRGTRLEGAPLDERAAGPANPPYGVPGLETTLPLLLTAVSENRLTIEDITRLCFENPSRIFCYSRNCDGEVEVDLNKSYTIENKNLFTKCRWSPFDGWGVKGKVKRVWIRGKKVFEDGKILVKPGFGKTIY